jgi:hypothetical protein
VFDGRVESARHGQHRITVRWIVEGVGDSKRKPSQCGDRDKVGSAARECSWPVKEGDPSAAGMIPKLENCRAAAWHNDGSKQTRERVTRNSEY